MKCIFCEQESSKSKSVEHIIPESFGNSISILRKGIVCDKCNNYFARKVESPFLNSSPVLKLREELCLKNKRGRVPAGRFPFPKDLVIKEIKKDKTFEIKTCKDLKPCELDKIVKFYKKYVGENDEELIRQDYNLSRLLTKIAVEKFVEMNNQTEEVCQYILEEKVFDEIRKYARYGAKTIWEFNARRIYSRDEAYKGDSRYAINWESDFLFTELGEVYHILVLFGIEYAINLGGPHVDGYREWLKTNNDKSPLYISREEKEENYKKYFERISLIE